PSARRWQSPPCSWAASPPPCCSCGASREKAMSLIISILVGVGMGIVFGFALEKSRVFEPGIIVGQMQMRNFIMIKVFLTAVATGAVVLAVLNGFGYVKLQPKAALYAAD